jgi:hypothetical protein
MSDKILVIILKGETRPLDVHLKKLKSHFNDNQFIIHVLDCKTQDDTIHYRAALMMASTKYEHYPCLIIKDSSLINKINIKKILLTILSLSDIGFLCQYQGQCHQYFNVDDYPQLKWTTSAFATQAILLTPRAVSLLLKDLKNIKESLLKAQKELKAIVCTPNIVHFDINLATSNEDFYKLNECAFILKDDDQIDHSTNMVWLFLIIILILFLVIIVPYFKHYKQLL